MDETRYQEPSYEEPSYEEPGDEGRSYQGRTHQGRSYDEDNWHDSAQHRHVNRPQRRRIRPGTVLAVLAGGVAIAFAIVTLIVLHPQDKPIANQGPPPPVSVPSIPAPKGTTPKPQPKARPHSAKPTPARPAPSARPAPTSPAGPVLLSLASYFDNVGITSNSRPTIGDLDGSGGAFSLQALAAHGAHAGGIVRHDGVSFAWPGSPAGTADNVTAAGQTLAVHGSGRTLSFLVTAGWGPASGKATVVYAGGATQTFTIGAADWWTGCSPSGPSVVIFTPYRNWPQGQIAESACVYYFAVHLKSQRDLREIILPRISAATPTGKSLHIFAITIH